MLGQGNVRRMSPAELRDYCLSLAGADETFPLSQELGVQGRRQNVLPLTTRRRLASGQPQVRARARLGTARRARGRASRIPLNKRHWNTVIIDGSLPDDAIRDMIEDSYDLVVSKLPPVGRRALGGRSDA